MVSLFKRLIRCPLGPGLVSIVFMLTASAAFAIPTLQLDIGGGTYDPATETIVARDNPFTLYALLSPNSKSTLAGTYYVSAALVQRGVPSFSDAGSFTFNGMTVSAAGDMVYGAPPLESSTGSDPRDLPSHGVFEAYYWEYGFQFDPANTALRYNTQDDAGAGPTVDPLGSLYYAAFGVDTRLLDPAYVLHFDLYRTKPGKKNGDDLIIAEFAPFSHDAESNGFKVPEPGSFLLLTLGVMGLALLRRLSRKSNALV